MNAERNASPPQAQKAINPVTRSNWEGTGVTPDLPVGEAKALDTAYLTALEKLASGPVNPRGAAIRRACSSPPVRRPW